MTTPPRSRPSLRSRWAAALTACLLPLAACHGAETPAPHKAPPRSEVTVPTAPAPGTATGPRLEADADRPAAEDEATLQARRLETFRQELTELSEPDADFFSDNYISNETSYLQVAKLLSTRVAPGGAYVGVGPEQNFTYIALTRPRVAYIVDIRRQNLLLHLVYKAAFAEAKSRSHFLALLVGRPWDEASDPGPGADISAVLAHAESKPRDEATWRATSARFAQAAQTEWGLALSEADLRALTAAHRAFFDGQLGIRFKLDFNNGRLYPTLRELLSAESPEGEAQGFLATEDAFRFVQQMEREHRVIPVVGDFAGDKAMRGVADAIAHRQLEVSAFYVSNVEQYLLEPLVWEKWRRNVRQLPVGPASVFVRAYLDQGARHPRQLDGHRTATVVASIPAFNAREERAPASFLALSTTDVVTDRAAP